MSVEGNKMMRAQVEKTKLGAEVPSLFVSPSERRSSAICVPLLQSTAVFWLLGGGFADGADAFGCPATAHKKPNYGDQGASAVYIRGSTNARTRDDKRAARRSGQLCSFVAVGGFFLVCMPGQDAAPGTVNEIKEKKLKAMGTGSMFEEAVVGPSTVRAGTFAPFALFWW